MKNLILLFTLSVSLCFSQSQSSNREIPPDIKVITNHTTSILGKKISYSAQAGTQPVWDSRGNVIAALYYTYYKRTDLEDDSNRPIAFSFNGGPGSASIWMHLGYTGPYSLIIDDEGYPIQPYGYKSNPYSILDVADIVFVNPVNVGFSRILKEMTKEEATKKFFGMKQDIQYLAEWISTFVTREERWKSPKYLIGESYGGPRVMGLAYELQQVQWMHLNGVVLVSPADYEIGYDERGGIVSSIVDFPYMTATAWYHNKLGDDLQKKPLLDVIEISENFAYEELLPALARGGSIEKDEKNSLATDISNLIGINQQEVIRNNLNISTNYN